ncbi:helix-turn-helix protein [Scopulibacillus darangshiensis]|uniref:Helix-turn-helix protein n=1 Tax=Scopulibacillus darangshiensis TaxID=442528 RepID=A0A4R2NZQ9_9BACL|nr:helix-turn-helix transcriptional regulator [Scopulibacillus darangshiensis]TCP27800.1 helix-turn-helix protein [Scopulibacillus darangshiensis]
MDTETEQLRRAVGKAIRARRLMKDLTIKSLSRIAKVDEGYISELELGKSNITLNTLFKLAAGLDLDKPDELLNDAKREVYSLMKEKGR